MDKEQVFISYKADEFDQAFAVKKHLEANGITCWMAPMSIQGGASYAQSIPQAIRECTVFVLILSELAQQSKWVPREVDQAINSGKVIMPYMLENCPLRNDFSFYLTNVQRYDAFRDPEETLDRMTRDIQELLGITPPVKEEAVQEQVPAEPEKTNPPKPKKVKRGKDEKKPVGKKKKRWPWILIGALLSTAIMITLLVNLLLPNKLTLGGVEFEVDDYSVRLENVTLTQADVNRFSEFQNLSTIELNHCTIEAQNLQPMGLSSLMSLGLKDCNITTEQFSTIDFSSISYFGNLYVSGNPNLTSIAGLEACPEQLEELDISDTGIADFDWLQSFTKLKVLRADRTGLRETSLLESLIYLEELSLSGNGITSLDGLKNTSKLSVVDLSHNDLTDVSVLSRSAACLTVLHLEYNSLTDLDCLSGAEGLRKVYVDANALTNLNWLRSRNELRVLSAAQNSIESIAGLGAGGKLYYVNLSNNRLQSVATADLLFEDGSYVMVDLSNNALKSVQLPGNCTYKQLVVLGNPDLQLPTLNETDGWNLYFDFPQDVSLQILKELTFNKLCIVGCPLDRQVEIEEGLTTEQLMTEAEALEEIAQKAKEADY